MEYFLGGILNLSTSLQNKHHKRAIREAIDDKKPPLRTHKIDKGVSLRSFARENLHKIEVAKSKAPVAAWARLSAQGIFPSTFKLSPTGN